MQKLTSAVLLAGSLLWSAVAGAQEFGSKGDAVFSAERLMGVHASHEFRDSAIAGPREEDYNSTGLGFAWFGATARTPYDLPRLAFDYLVIDHLSIGGSIAYASSSDSANNGIPGGVRADTSQFLFAPRVGYAYMFGRVVGIWPRGGLTYHDESVNGGSDTNGFGIDLDAMFVFVPVQHFAFTLGPSFDVDFTGNFKPANAGSKVDHGYRSFGLQVGLLGWI